MRLAAVLTVFSTLFVASCKLTIIVPEHGRVTTLSGNFQCDSGATCDIDIADTLFDETFITEPSPGYAFDGWQADRGYLCGSSTAPCRLFTTLFAGNEAFESLLESELTLLLAPRFRPSDVFSAGQDMLLGSVTRATCTVDGKLYVFGAGWETGSSLDTTQEYDPDTGSWRFRAPMPTARAWAAATALDGKCYVIGGGASFASESSVEVYDPASNRWEVLSPFPSAVYSASAVAVDGKLYVMGGSEGLLSGGAPGISKLYVYDPGSGRWSQGPAMSISRRRFAAAVINREIYVVGGEDRREPLASLEIFNPTTNSWRSGASQPEPLLSQASASFDGKLYVFGGFRTRVGITDVWVYDPETDQWRMLSHMTHGRGDLSVEALGNRLVVVGGRETDHFGPSTAATELYSP